MIRKTSYLITSSLAIAMLTALVIVARFPLVRASESVYWYTYITQPPGVIAQSEGWYARDGVLFTDDMWGYPDSLICNSNGACQSVRVPGTANEVRYWLQIDWDSDGNWDDIYYFPEIVTFSGNSWSKTYTHSPEAVTIGGTVWKALNVTIRSGTHTIHAEQCQFGNDNTYYLNFLFEPAVDLGLSQQTSRITYEDAADKLRDLPDYFKMSYSIDGYIKTIEIGPDPALELGKWYPLPDPPLQENAEVMVTVVSYTGPGPGPVGGILIPVDKFGLLAPYIGLTSTILVATVATAVYVKRVKRKKEKQ